MKKIWFFTQIAICLSFWVFFLAPSIFAASASIEKNTNSPSEQQKAVEEVNSLIIGSYKSRLDRVLDELYSNIEEASRGSVIVQVDALQKVRDDLDERLDILSEESISPNRRKILTGIYFYLKSNIEWRIRATASSTSVGAKRMPLK